MYQQQKQLLRVQLFVPAPPCSLGLLSFAEEKFHATFITLATRIIHKF